MGIRIAERFSRSKIKGQSHEQTDPIMAEAYTFRRRDVEANLRLYYFHKKFTKFNLFFTLFERLFQCCSPSLLLLPLLVESSKFDL